MNASDPKAYTIRGVDSMPAAIASPLHLAPVEDKGTLILMFKGSIRARMNFNH